MRRIYYSSGSMVTADTVCASVLRYARALAFDRSSDVITIPVVGEGGEIVQSHLLIGPSSQFFTMPVLDSVEEFDAEDLIADLELRTSRLQPSAPSWPDGMEDVAVIEPDYPMPG